MRGQIQTHGIPRIRSLISVRQPSSRPFRDGRFRSPRCLDRGLAASAPDIQYAVPFQDSGDVEQTWDELLVLSQVPLAMQEPVPAARTVPALRLRCVSRRKAQPQSLGPHHCPSLLDHAAARAGLRQPGFRMDCTLPESSPRRARSTVVARNDAIVGATLPGSWAKSGEPGIGKPEPTAVDAPAGNAASDSDYSKNDTAVIASTAVEWGATSVVTCATCWRLGTAGQLLDLTWCRHVVRSEGQQASRLPNCSIW